VQTFNGVRHLTLLLCVHVFYAAGAVDVPPQDLSGGKGADPSIQQPTAYLGSLPDGGTVAFLSNSEQKYLSLCDICTDGYGNPQKSVVVNGSGLSDSDGSSTFTIQVLSSNQFALQSVFDKSYLGVIDANGTVGSNQRGTPTSAETWTAVAVDPDDSTVIGLENLQTGTFLTASATTGLVDTSATTAGNAAVSSTWIVHMGS